MKIDFNTGDIGECHDAQKLRLLLREILRHQTDPAIQELVRNLIDQLESELKASGLTAIKDEAGNEAGDNGGRSLTGLLCDAWRSFTGPSRREMELSRQRKELIERAEHAEASAFDALAETADIGRERDAAIERIRQLEEELARRKDGD